MTSTVHLPSGMSVTYVVMSDMDGRTIVQKQEATPVPQTFEPEPPPPIPAVESLKLLANEFAQIGKRMDEFDALNKKLSTGPVAEDNEWKSMMERELFRCSTKLDKALLCIRDDFKSFKLAIEELGRQLREMGRHCSHHVSSTPSPYISLDE